MQMHGGAKLGPAGRPTGGSTLSCPARVKRSRQSRARAAQQPPWGGSRQQKRRSAASPGRPQESSSPSPPAPSLRRPTPVSARARSALL